MGCPLKFARFHQTRHLVACKPRITCACILNPPFGKHGDLLEMEKASLMCAFMFPSSCQREIPIITKLQNYPDGTSPKYNADMLVLSHTCLCIIHAYISYTMRQTPQHAGWSVQVYEAVVAQASPSGWGTPHKGKTPRSRCSFSLTLPSKRHMGPRHDVLPRPT